MGMFLMMSGIAQAGRSQVETALRDLTAQRSGTLTPLADSENVDENELLLIAESEQGNATVLYPASFLDWDGASEHLSKFLNKSVFSLHVHDSDLWMYLFFVNGQEIDRFNPIPDYWEELPDDELHSWAGDATVVCQHWPPVSEAQISNYLVRWENGDDEEDRPKAYPEDEYGAGEDWQIVDFMAKVGLVYPIDEQGNEVGVKYRFSVQI